MKRTLAAAMASLSWLSSACPALAAPAVPEKAEVVFADDFENAQAPGWTGGKVISARPADSKGALEAATGAMILSRAISFDSTAETYMTFRYHAEECYSLCVQFNDKTRGDNFKTFIVPVQRRQWATATFNITADIQGCGDHLAGIKGGDTLVNALVWPAEKLPGARLIVDDVAIYHLGPPARAARMLADLAQAEKDYAPAVAPFAAELAGLRKEIAAATSQQQVGELETKAADLRERMKRAWLLQRMRQAHANPKAEYVVGVESPLVRVTDQNQQMPFAGRVEKACSIAAAGHEYENCQLIVIPVEKDLEKVTAAFSDLAGPGGTIAKDNLQWRLVEDVKSKPSYGYARSLHGWKPDPLLPGAPFDLKVGRMKALWITTYVPPEAKPGDYAGRVTVTPANSPPVSVALNLHVWNYRLPLRGRFRHMCQFQPQSGQKRRENYAYLMQYRLSPTAQYSRSPAPVAEDIPFCYERGITTFVAGNHPGPAINVEVVRPYYEALKAAGCLDLAVIYIGDEGTSPEALAQFRQKAVTVKKHFPGLRVMVGGSTPRKELIGYLDVWDPIMSMTAGAGQGYEYNRQAVEARKPFGEEVLWYMAGVRPPYPAIELDPPTPSMRMFPWITFKYGIGGWEVYGTQGGWEKPANKTWPKTPWDTYTWRTYNGSGQFFYPGGEGVPLASIRIENARDGIEDYESLALLQDAIDAAREVKSAAAPDPALLAAAERIVAVRPEMLTNMWDWTRDPATIESARAELSRTLDKLVTAIGRATFDDFVAQRAEARRKANNEAYQKRLEAFLASPAATETATATAPAK